MSSVFLITEDFFSGLEKAFSEFGFKKRFSGKRVAVKLHFGERGNLNYIRPALVSRIVELLKAASAKPFLFDSVTKYHGKRFDTKDYFETARLNGFSEQTMGCPIVIGDSGKTINGKIVPIEVCKEIVEADAMLVISHCKGHAFSALGGAIKNLGMGCVSRKTKKALHDSAQPVVFTENCIGCKACETVCPESAINVKNGKASVDYDSCLGCDLCIAACKQSALKPKIALADYLLASSALEILNCFKKENLLFVNVLLSISARCDCYSREAGAIMPDIGLLVSDNIVAIDSASIELINKKFGKDFFASLGYRSPLEQIKWLEQNGFDSKGLACAVDKAKTKNIAAQARERVPKPFDSGCIIEEIKNGN